HTVHERQAVRIEDPCLRAEMAQDAFGFQRQEPAVRGGAQRAEQQQDSRSVLRNGARFELVRLRCVQMRGADVGNVLRHQSSLLPSLSTTCSPSSFVNERFCPAGRMSSTTSDGRHRRTPNGVTTNGRFNRIGCFITASSNCSSLSDISLRPSSAYGVPFSRSAARTVSPARAIRSLSVSRSGGVLRYSMISGSIPALRIIASVLREVPQSGL